MISFFSLRQYAGFLLLIFFLGVGNLLQAQVPVWQSIISTNSTAYSIVTTSVADANGNIYVCGSFRGSITLGTTTLSSAGGTDLFLAKWQPQSNRFTWVQKYGGAGDEWPTDLAVSGTSVYMTGYFLGAPFQFGTTTLPDNGSNLITAFVAKLTDGGTVAAPAWALRLNTNPTYTEAEHLVVAGAGVYVAGTFQNTAQFGSFMRTSSGGGDVYVAKLLDAGPSASILWLQQAGGPLDDHAFQLVGYGSSLYVAGTFQGGAGFGSTTLNATSTDAFVAKLLDAGSSAGFTWAERVGNTSSASATVIGALAVAGPSVYLAGEFSQTITLGSLVLTAPFGNNSNTFVAKLTDVGSTAMFQWAQQAGGAGGYTAARALAVAGPNVYVAGSFSSRNAQFGTTTLTNANQSGFSNDAFVTKLADAGPTATFSWARQAGSNADGESAATMALQGTTLVVGGSAIPPAAFGSLLLTGAAGATTGFLATLTDPTLTAATPFLRAKNLAVFPNPAHTAATVQLPAVPGTTQATLTLTDALGRAVRTYQVPLPAAGATAVLPLAGLAPGFYHLRVQAGGQQAIRALVVE